MSSLRSLSSSSSDCMRPAVSTWPSFPMGTKAVERNFAWSLLAPLEGVLGGVDGALCRRCWSVEFRWRCEKAPVCHQVGSVMRSIFSYTSRIGQCAHIKTKWPNTDNKGAWWVPSTQEWSYKSSDWPHLLVTLAAHRVTLGRNVVWGLQEGGSLNWGHLKCCVLWTTRQQPGKISLWYR